MKLNLNKSLVNLDGGQIENSNMGKILAQALANTNKGDAVKFWHIAVKLHNGEDIELDPSDHKTLRDFVNTNEQLPVITKAQMLLIFDASK